MKLIQAFLVAGFLCYESNQEEVLKPILPSEVLVPILPGEEWKWKPTDIQKSDENGRFSPDGLWPKVGKEVIVPYTFNEATAQIQKTFIEAADDFARWTCVKFVPRTDQKSYIQVHTLDRCYSAPGRTYIDAPQKLFLSPGCALQKGIVAHEMMHALRFSHEHQRSDRDEYVKINMENVKEEVKGQFDKDVDVPLDTPYDYESVLQYRSDECTKNGFKTIEALRPLPPGMPNLGQRKGISALDALDIDHLYKCNGHTIMSNEGWTIPSREPLDTDDNCCDIKDKCNDPSHLDMKVKCARTCGPHPRC